MKRSHPSRFIAAIAVLISMLFMQLAVAGYACPSFQITPDDGSMSMAMPMAGADQAMTGCTDGDKLQPSLCHARDQNHNQSLDKPAAPHVSPFVPVSLTLIFRNIEPRTSQVGRQPNTFLLTRSTAPPLSIRNCCFRI